MRRSLVSVVVLACVILPALGGVARAEQDGTIRLTGCLLLSRRVDVYALHMEFNRIAAIGHPDLAQHVGHRVRLTGSFEERGDQLRFVVAEIEDIAPTCESQASRRRPAVETPPASAG